MKTKIKQINDTVIVTMEGQLNHEMQEPLKNNLKKLLEKSQTDTIPQKIIFDFKDLDFVGSSGISSFVQTLKSFNASAPTKPRYCNVRSEFQKVIRIFDEEDEFEIYDSEERARKSFDQ